MGVTSREQQMIDFAEQGMTWGEIGERMDLDPAYVRARLSHLSGSPADDNRREAAIREGSRRLLAALERAGAKTSATAAMSGEVA